VRTRELGGTQRHVRGIGGGGGPRNEDVAVLWRVRGCVQGEPHHGWEDTGQKNARISLDGGRMWLSTPT
jgi:hypothetical protein